MAEQSHEATGVRERGMLEFKSTRQAQRFLTAPAAANPMLVASIAGWSVAGAGISPVMLRYGAASVATSEGLMALEQESKKIRAHLLDLRPSHLSLAK